MQEDRKLKISLVLQSFSPLFVLIFIKHVGHFDSVFRFFASLFRGDWSVIGRAWESKYLGDVFITVLCIAWFLVTVIVALGFKNYQSCNFDHYGEKIEIQSEKKDSGVSYLVTILLPLMLDDASSWRSFLFFIVLLAMVIFLMIQSDLFYQNPVLVALRYKFFEFKFISPNQDVKGRQTYLGLSRGGLPREGIIVKRKGIADGVFLIDNDEKGERKESV